MYGFDYAVSLCFEQQELNLQHDAPISSNLGTKEHIASVNKQDV